MVVHLMNVVMSRKVCCRVHPCVESSWLDNSIQPVKWDFYLESMLRIIQRVEVLLL